MYSSYSLAQDCQLEDYSSIDRPYYHISSDNPEEYCTIPKDKSEEFFHPYGYVAPKTSISIDGNLAVNYLDAYRIDDKFFKLKGNLLLRSSHLYNAVISGNTEVNMDPDVTYGNKHSLHINNVRFDGNLSINSFLKPDQEIPSYISAPLTVAYSQYTTDKNYAYITGNFQLKTNDVLTDNGMTRNDASEDAAYGYNFNAAIRIGDHYDFSNSYRGARAPVYFMVAGSSNIHLHNTTKKIKQNETLVRSAIGLLTPGYGSVLALSEQYNATKHALERYKNKVYFGERSSIHTEADYSHGLLLSGQSETEMYVDGNQVYVNNKGKIQVDGKASAISAYLYRVQTTKYDYETVADSTKVDDVDIVSLKNIETPSLSSLEQAHKIVSKLPDNRSAYIIPSLFNNKDFFDKEDPDFDLVFNRKGGYGLDIDVNKKLKFLAHAKKHFDPNEKVIEINNSGELIAPNGYVFSGSMFKDVFTSTGGKLDGKLVLNNGSDEVSLAKTDLTKLTELNGAETSGRKAELKKTVKMAVPHRGPGYYEGKQEHFIYVDIPQSINALNINQELTGSSTSSGQAGDTKIVNWDIINIGTNAEAKLNLTGNLEDGWDDVKKKSADIFDEKSRKKELNIAKLGTLALVKGKETTVGYNVTNAGIIDLTQNAMVGNTLIIDGNYEGKEGELLVDSQWNNPDKQQTDKLLIKGNASGKKTTVKAPAGIIGDVTKADKVKNGNLNNPVVEVEGKDNNAFEGKASTTNAGEAQLVKTVTADGKSQYHWTLGIKDDEQEIINKPSTAYTQSQAVARELGFMTLGRLNQRLGELTNSTEPQTWLRTRFEDDFLNGKNRFATKSQRHLVQIGQDVALWQDQNKLSRLGVTFSHSKANAKFFDKYRAENGEVISNKLTTEAKLTALSLGGYFTQRYNNGAYIDFVGQLSHLKFNYLGEAQAKQKGYAIGASVEVGYPIALNSIWDVEPQAQLSYQHVHLSAFGDAQQRQIAKQTSNNLRARLGVRLVANKQLYLGANLHYDLMGNQSKANVGRSYLAEKYGRLIAELELGGKIDLGKNVSLNIEAYYKKNLSQGHDAVQINRSPSELGGQTRLQVKF
ncbi:autotransporter outer membrane beta-barrel domain-containing protein [Haemophilus haemoglobinophilus]|nr:autotransporter outer membrane beta-barrel domain-containing protein [Canicola haemoglobinophilus]